MGTRLHFRTVLRAPASLTVSIAVFASIAAACGGNPAAPESAEARGARLAIVAEPVVTLNRGETRTLSVEERDGAGRPVAGPPESYTWASSAPAVVEAAPGGVLRAGSGHGYALVTVRTATGLSASTHVWVQPPPGAPSAFRITLVFAPDVPANFRDALASAAGIWESLIRDELPPADLGALPERCLMERNGHAPPPQTGLERGVRIYVGVASDVDPTSYAEAFGGPCVQRPLPTPTTVFDRITLNRLKPLEVARRKPRRRQAERQAPFDDAVSGIWMEDSGERRIASLRERGLDARERLGAVVLRVAAAGLRERRAADSREQGQCVEVHSRAPCREPLERLDLLVFRDRLLQIPRRLEPGLPRGELELAIQLVAALPRPLEARQPAIHLACPPGILG